MALVGKSRGRRDIGQPIRPAQQFPGLVQTPGEEMGMGWQARGAGHHPGQMPGGEPNDPGQVRQIEILGEVCGHDFQGEPHGPGFGAWRAWQLCLFGVTGHPGGKQGQKSGFLGQGGGIRCQEQGMGPGQEGGQVRVSEDAGPKYGRRSVFPQHELEGRCRQVEHAIAPAVGSGRCAVVGDAGLGQAQVPGRRDQAFPAIAKGQGPGFDDTQGVILMGVAGEVLLAVAGAQDRDVAAQGCEAGRRDCGVWCIGEQAARRRAGDGRLLGTSWR